MSNAIVCGIDGSPGGTEAARAAAHLSERLGLRLLVVHVAPSTVDFSAGAVVFTPVEFDQHERDVERLVQRVIATEHIAAAETRVMSGDPAERLVDLADEENAAMIVVGSRGRGAFKSALLGSVSRAVIGLARCPVVVVPAESRITI